MLTGTQLRMARAALRMTTEGLAALAMCDQGTIVRIEAGKRAYRVTMMRLRDVLEKQGIVFLDGKEGEHEATVALRWGFDPARPDAATSAAKGEAAGEGGQSAAAWDVEDWEGDAPALERIRDAAPVDLTDEDRAAIAEHYRARPEAWAALHEVSRLALLRAMGLERLDSAPENRA